MPTTALIAAGITGAAGIGAAAIGGYSQTQAAKIAAGTETNLYNEGLGVAGQYYTSATNALNPFETAGTNALTRYQNRIPYLTSPFSAATLPSTPGYQFTLGQGLQSTQNSYAAEGLGSSGAAEKGAASYATGLAQNTYNQQFQNYLAQNSQIANLLYQPVTAGTSAASAQSSLAAVLGGAGLSGAVQTGGNVGSAQIGAGNAVAGAATGGANALTGGVNTALQYSLLSQYLGNLSGSNNIVPSVNAYNTNMNTFQNALATNNPFSNTNAAQPWTGYGGGYTGG